MWVLGSAGRPGRELGRVLRRQRGRGTAGDGEQLLRRERTRSADRAAGCIADCSGKLLRLKCGKRCALGRADLMIAGLRSGTQHEIGRGTRIETTPEQVRVVMPVPRIGCAMAFLSLWMMGWAVGEFSAIKGLFSTGMSFATLVLITWLVGWTAGGIVFGSILLLMLDGREVVTVGEGIVRRRVEAFRVGLSWRYPLDQVSNWRPTGGTGEDAVKSFISFDHVGPKGSKTIRFGTGLTEPRAEEITEAVWERFPHLRPRP